MILTDGILLVKLLLYAVIPRPLGNIECPQHDFVNSMIAARNLTTRDNTSSSITNLAVAAAPLSACEQHNFTIDACENLIDVVVETSSAPHCDQLILRNITQSTFELEVLDGDCASW